MNKQAQKSAQELLTFIDKSPVSYFAVANIVKELQDNGYRSLDEGKKWKLEPGQKYYVQRNNSAPIAFQLGSNMP